MVFLQSEALVSVALKCYMLHAMDAEANQFTTSALTRVAGCEPVTLRSWRNRNGLFPTTVGKQGWNRFSLIDVCIARVVVLMTASAVSAGDAIWLAETYLRTPFKLAHSGDLEGDLSGIVAFAPKVGADAASIRPYVQTQDIPGVLQQFGGFVQLLDLNVIYAEVSAGLINGANLKKDGE